MMSASESDAGHEEVARRALASAPARAPISRFRRTPAIMLRAVLLGRQVVVQDPRLRVRDAASAASPGRGSSASRRAGPKV